MTDEKDINNPENLEESQAENEQQDVAVEAASGEVSSEASDEAASGEVSSEASDEAASGEVSNESAEVSQDDENKVVNEEDASEDDAEAAMLAMLEDLPEDDGKAELGDIEFPAKEPQSVSNVEFQHLSEPATIEETKNIDMLLDVNLPIAIELGRTKMSISNILALGPGSIVELAKLAGEPVDLLVNQRVVAKGEVVVIDENFGVRITQLLTPEERLKALGEEK